MTSRTGNRPFFLAVLAIALLAAATALTLNSLIFESIPHTEDEVAFLFQAMTLARGHLVAPAPPVPEAFWIPFVIVREGMWFGKYPPGYPVVLALGVLLHAPWLVNPLAFGLAVVLLALLGRTLYDAPTTLLAALLLATSPFALIQAGSFLSHVACLAWTLLFMLSFATTLKKPRVRSAVPGALALALLILSRPLTAVGVVLPFALWSALRFWRHPDWRSSALVFANGGIWGSLALLQYNRLTTGNPLTFGYELWWPFDRVGFGPSVGPGDDGHTLANGILNTRVNLEFLERVLFGWPGPLERAVLLLSLSVAVLALALRPFTAQRFQNRGSDPFVWDLVLAAQVASLVAVHLAYWTPSHMYGPRYYFEALGSLCLLAARGLQHLWSGWHVLWRLARPTTALPTWSRAVAVVLLLALIGWGIGRSGVPWWRSFYGWYDVRPEPARTVANAGLTHAIVFVPAQAWTDYAPFFIRNSPWLDSPVLYAWDRGAADNERVLAAFPDRAAYRVDLATGTLFPLR